MPNKYIVNSNLILFSNIQLEISTRQNLDLQCSKQFQMYMTDLATAVCCELNVSTENVGQYETKSRSLSLANSLTKREATLLKVKAVTLAIRVAV